MSVMMTTNLYEERSKKSSLRALYKMRTLRLFTNHKGKSKECLGRTKKDVEQDETGAGKQVGG